MFGFNAESETEWNPIKIMTRVRRFTLLFVFGPFSEYEILSNNLPVHLISLYSYENKTEYEIPSKRMHLNPFVTNFPNVKY